MPKTKRTIQQWDNWLTQQLGRNVLEAEAEKLPSLLTNCYGKHALLIGVPQQNSLLQFNTIAHHVLLSPLINQNKNIRYIEAELKELPIAPASIDLVLLPHTLEYIDNPQHLLAEACRIVKPEGHIIIFGFNPYSLWGLRKKITRDAHMPWTNHFLTPRIVKHWLALADFELVKQQTFLFRPPLNHTFYQHLKILEWIGNILLKPWGGVYMLMAKAKVIPLTPIKLHWKQQLSSIRVSIPGPSMRNGQ